MAEVRANHLETKASEAERARRFEIPPTTSVGTSSISAPATWDQLSPIGRMWSDLRRENNNVEPAEIRLIGKKTSIEPVGMAFQGLDTFSSPPGPNFRDAVKGNSYYSFPIR